MWLQRPLSLTIYRYLFRDSNLRPIQICLVYSWMLTDPDNSLQIPPFWIFWTFEGGIWRKSRTERRLWRVFVDHNFQLPYLSTHATPPPTIWGATVIFLWNGLVSGAEPRDFCSQYPFGGEGFRPNAFTCDIYCVIDVDGGLVIRIQTLDQSKLTLSFCY